MHEQPRLIFTPYNAALAGSILWRVNVTATQGTTGQWCSIQEIEFRGSVGGADLTAANSSDGGNAIANVNGGSNNWPWWAFDGTGAPWQSGIAPSAAAPAWIGYRFPTQVDVAEVAIKCTGSPGDAPKTFTIDKWTGSGWTTVKTVADAAWTANQQKVFSVP